MAAGRQSPPAAPQRPVRGVWGVYVRSVLRYPRARQRETENMEWLIIIGTLVALTGLVGLVVSAMRVIRARRAGLAGDALRDAIRGAMVLNMGAFAVSAFGLTMVVVGVILA